MLHRNPAQWAGVTVLLATVWTLGLLPVRVVSEGWRPGDDALRHVAKAVSGRDWNDVLVLRPGVVDPHPGWHALLGWVHRSGIQNPRRLLNFSVILLAALVMVAPLWGVDRPEAWMFALLLLAVGDPQVLGRFFLGRPYLVSMAVLLFLGSIWKRLADERPPVTLLAVLVALLVLANWMHGNGYLWLLPLGAFVLAGELRVARRFTACLVVGIVGGALLTGHPITFLEQTLLHPVGALGSGAPTRLLVTEFQPSSGSPVFLGLAGVVLIGLWRKDAAPMAASRDPLVWLAIGGWVLGLYASRSWSDWGLPAALLLVAQHVEQWLEKEWPERTLTYALSALIVCAALTFAISMDKGGRWSSSARTAETYAPVFSAENRAWLPDPGGILFNSSMTVFYQGFYRNPEAPYRYLLGFEPGLLPENELRVYRDIQLKGASDESLRPWVVGLRATDRILVRRQTSPRVYSQMEWFSPQSGVWMGRLRRTPAIEAPARSTPNP